MDKCAVEGWITITAASKLFKASAIQETRLLEKAKTPGFKPIPLGINLSTTVRNDLKRDMSRNVVAILPGKKTSDEYIVYTAHWDHVGIGEPVQGDSIYNGAMDNATGTATLLSIARAYTQLPERPDRSVVFLAVTAEEQGLLGSAYYANNPTYSIERTVANINMDGMNYFGATKDLTIIGYGQSEMDDLATEEAERQGRYVLPDQEPAKGYFFRSDQFNFAKKGVPVLYAKGGYEHVTKGKEYIKQQKDHFTQNKYHRPGDEFVAGEWDMTGLQQDAQLLFNVGYRLANSERYPQWKEGSEFKSKRKPLLD